MGREAIARGRTSLAQRGSLSADRGHRHREQQRAHERMKVGSSHGVDRSGCPGGQEDAEVGAVDHAVAVQVRRTAAAPPGQEDAQVRTID
ncbi:MAG: hypothetical protein ACK55I_19205, partial [bacterium]